MEQQYVPLPYPVKYMAVITHPRYRLRLVLWILEMFKSFYAIYFHEECEIKRSIYLIHNFVIYSEMILEFLQELLVHSLIHLETDDLAPLSLLKLLFNLL